MYYLSDPDSFPKFLEISSRWLESGDIRQFEVATPSMAEQKSPEEGRTCHGHQWGCVKSPEKFKQFLECTLCHELAKDVVLLVCDFHSKDEDFESPVLCKGTPLPPPPLSHSNASINE